ncbi:MAG: protein kinase [Oscillospiraceae bacterium]|nr:protein kinase [Oscillospiraceae bacterium]
MVTVENFIETKYRDLGERLSIEYIDLYESFPNRKLQEIFSTIHGMLIENYRAMNDILPTNQYTAHYWADNSRELLLAFDVIRGLERVLSKTNNAFTIDPYYKEIIDKTSSFLEKSGDSTIPQGMEKIEIYYTEPIFRKRDSVKINSAPAEQQYADLKQIGNGSYATVFSFFDKFYNRKFVLKRANSDLSPKEIERFKQEFEQMTRLSSPYIVEVFRYDGVKNEYIMEYMDFTLKEYIEKQKPAIEERKNIIYQIFRAFKFIHSKNVLHRDISPANIMIKVYDDVNVVKVCDFGLVKLPDSDLTSIDTILKGCYNDPALITEGFKNYTILHETYALIRLIAFILTGKATADRITDAKLKAFVEKGLSPDKEKRFKSVVEMEMAFKLI